MHCVTNEAATVLVVDDDSSVTASIALLLKQAGFKYLAAADPQAALTVLDRHPVDLVIQDMNFTRATTGEAGLLLLREIRERQAELPVVLITAWGSIALAVEGMKLGAADFVTKPWDNTRLLQVVKTILSLAKSRGPEPEREALDAAGRFSEIVGRHASLMRVLSHVARISRTDATVLITGESGTGKELLADAIYRNSNRCERPLIKVNMGGIVASLFESEMFGHVRGAFTDARRDRIGYFEQADGGTIFLDEIGDLDPPSQVKLLRVLQEREFRRVGCGALRKADVRVIAATNQDLGRLVAQRRFREDLYYRLNLITLELPPLRVRKSDIALIAASHLEKIRQLYGLEGLQCDATALEWLEAQRWPGNIRQLKQSLERAALLSGRRKLTREELQSFSTDSSSSSAVPAISNLPLEDMERRAIETAMAQSAQNVSRAAEILGLSRAALYRRLAKHGLVRE